jgi:hypothetical protein
MLEWLVLCRIQEPARGFPQLAALLAAVQLLEMIMENDEIKPHASVLSRSALSAYITGPVNPNPPPKSTFNPYRKRAGLFNFMNLEAAEEALQKSIAKEEATQEVLTLPDSVPPLSGVTAPT